MKMLLRTLKKQTCIEAEARFRSKKNKPSKKRYDTHFAANSGTRVPSAACVGRSHLGSSVIGSKFKLFQCTSFLLLCEYVVPAHKRGLCDETGRVNQDEHLPRKAGRFSYRHVDAVVVQVDEKLMAKAREENDTTVIRLAKKIPGVYHKVGYFDGWPCFRQEHYKNGFNNDELFLWHLQDKGLEGLVDRQGANQAWKE